MRTGNSARLRGTPRSAAGLAACFGTGIGGRLHVLAAALGLSLLVAQSAMAFNLVKYLGAAYLVCMGVRPLLRKDHAPAIEQLASQGARCARAWSWRR